MELELVHGNVDSFCRSQMLVKIRDISKSGLSENLNFIINFLFFDYKTLNSIR